MISNRKHLILFLLFFVPMACNDEDAWDCVKTTGSTSQLVFGLDSVSEVVLENNVDLILRQGSQQEVVLRGGENVIAGIDVFYEQGQLKVINDNDCNWVRSFRHPQLILTVPSLRKLSLMGFGHVTTESIFATDTFIVDAQSYAGIADLELEAQSVSVVSGDVGNITMSGTTNRLALTYNYVGKFFGKELEATSVVVNHGGVNSIEVNPREFLAVQITSRGSVCFVQRPIVLVTFPEDTDQVFPCDE